MYSLGVRSKARLKGVHPDLIKVVEKAIQLTTVDFTVLEGVRDAVRQKKLVESGASQTMNSRHIPGAVGLAAVQQDCRSHEGSGQTGRCANRVGW